MHHHQAVACPPPLPIKPPETVVVFSFCEEPVPYRIKIPGTQPTLRQFKDFLPRRGHFRYVCCRSSIPHNSQRLLAFVLPFADSFLRRIVKTRTVQ